MRFTSRGFAAVTVAAGLVFAAGCSSPDYVEPNPPSEAQVAPDKQFNDLMQRPSLEEVAARYEEMQTKIKDRLRAELALPEWAEGNKGAESSCTNEFPEVDSYDAGRKTLTNLRNPEKIAADKWPQARAVLAEVGAEYGFTKPGLDVSKPPYFDVKIGNEYNAELSLGTDEQTVLAVSTGCHLYADVKQRGVPTPKPSY